MRWLRAALRFKLILLTTLGICFLWATGAALAFWSPTLRRDLRHWAFSRWSRSLLAIMKARVEVTGRPPSSPFILVSNHLSYVDIVLIASQATAVFVAKREIRSWPVIGFLARCMGTIFIDRGARRDIPRVLAQMDRVMRSGEGVVVFPEGTSGKGDRVLPFRPPLLEAAFRTGVPVSCAALRYDTPTGAPPASRVVCWWGGMTLHDHLVRLLSLPHFSAEIHFGSSTIQETDRKVLADRLWQAVDDLFEPLAHEERECA